MNPDDDDTRLEVLRGLSLAREPERDLWPGIASRIAPPRRRRALPWLGALAASVAITALTLQLWPATQPDTSVEVAAVLAEPLPPAGQVMTQQDALLKANLAIASDAEAQLRHALELDPDSPSLQRLLLSVERRQNDLRTRIGQQQI
jgi:hypothetical protein